MDKLAGGWDDLVFEYRHRDYGAYILRYNYPFNVTIAALIVIILFISIMVGIQLYTIKKAEGSWANVIRVNYNEYVALKSPPRIERIQIKPVIKKYVTPNIVREEVGDDETMATMKELTAKLEPGKDIIINPEFPGGMDALTRWLNENLIYPAIASLMGIDGRVVVEFNIDENGKISKVTVTEHLHKACDLEAIRLVNTMPDWIPGTRNGRKITLRCVLPIRFVVQ